MRACGGRSLVLGFVGVVGVGCNGEVPGNEPMTVVTSAIVQPPGNLYPFQLPPGVTREQVAVAGLTNVFVNDRTSTTGAITSAGGVNIGSAASVGNVVALGENLSTAITLRDRARINGSVRSQKGVLRGSGVTITGQLVANTNLGVPTEFGITVSYPTDQCQTMTLPPDMEVVATPGVYCQFMLNARSKLRVRAGTYFVRQLNIEPTAQLIVDKSGGPVIIYVADTLALKGSIVHAAGNIGDLLLAYLGDQTVHVQTPMTGTIFAPFATIDAKTVSVAHRGAFFANNVVIHQDSRITPTPFPWSATAMMQQSFGGGTMAIPGCPIGGPIPPGFDLHCPIPPPGSGVKLKCFCTPKPIDPPITSTVDLKYMIVTTMYAAPGNMSGVSYAVGSSAGCSYQVVHSTSSGVAYDFSVSTIGGGAEVSGQFTKGKKEGHGISFTESIASGVGLGSTSDVPSHLDDTFYLWLNAQMQGTKRFVNSVNINILPSGVAPGADGQLHPSVGPDGQPRMVIQTITARELLDPSQIPAARRGLFFRFTPDDFSAILATNPFFVRAANGTWSQPDPATIVTNPARFRFLGGAAGNAMLFGPSAVMGPTPQTNGRWQYDTTRDMIDGSTSHFEVTVLAGPKFSVLGALDFDLKFGGTWSWDYEDTRTNTMGLQKEATYTLATSTPCLVANVSAYLDLVYGSFVMVPSFSNFTCNAPCPSQPAQQNNNCECRVDAQCPATGCDQSTHMCRR